MDQLHAFIVMDIALPPEEMTFYPMTFYPLDKD